MKLPKPLKVVVLVVALAAIWYLSEFEDHGCLSVLIFHPIRHFLFLLATPWVWLTIPIQELSSGNVSLYLFSAFLASALLPIALNGLSIWALLVKFRLKKFSHLLWALYCLAGIATLGLTRNASEANVLFERHYGSPWVVYVTRFEDWHYTKVTSTSFHPWSLLFYITIWVSVFLLLPKWFKPSVPDRPNP